jgi:hypothetical protein
LMRSPAGRAGMRSSSPLPQGVRERRCAQLSM